MRILENIAKHGGYRASLIILLFRISSRCERTRFRKNLLLPIRLFYQFVSRWVFNVELCDNTHVGSGLVLWHGAHGSVINPGTVIGRNFNLRQNTTIGSSSFWDNTKCPRIGNNVQVGPNCVILGKIHIGDNTFIGGSVVIKDVPDNAIVAGNPARVIKILNANDKL